VNECTCIDFEKSTARTPVEKRGKSKKKGESKRYNSVYSVYRVVVE
jgi:hypothetical protein